MLPTDQRHSARRLLSTTALALAMAIATILIWPAGADQTEAQLVRTKANAAALSTRLSQKLYRTESYQAEYTEQVPYEATEVYYEDVPYQVEETYTDYEEYTDYEQRCHDETRYEQRCHPETKCETIRHRQCFPQEVCENVPRQKCETQQECSDVPRQKCDMKEECSDVPRQKCETQEECSSVPRQKCEAKEVCSDHPERVCENERVCTQVPRQVCKTEQSCTSGGGGGFGRPGHPGGGPNPPVCTPKTECHIEQEEKCGTVPKCRIESRRQCTTQQQCHTEIERECRQKPVCHTESERQCRQKPVCHTETEHQCRPKQVCHTETDRQCRQKEVCQGPPDEQRCHDEQVCQQVPVPHRECRMEPVTKTRPVQKTRWVTKYRQEERTRTVTRYREETRCCVTKQRQVFDHEYAANVKLLFPEQATLEDGEREIFLTELTGVDEAANVRVSAAEVLYTYNTEVNQTGPNAFEVKMSLLPTYRGDELGVATIKDFAVTQVGDHLQVSFKDAGALAKVQSAYSLQLQDAASGAVLAQAERPASSGKKNGQKISWNLTAAIAAGTQVRAVMSVARTGVVIAQQPVQFFFDQPVTVQAEPPYDPKPFSDAAKIKSLQATGKKVSLAISFIDATKLIEQVTTAYALKVSVLEKQGPRLLVEKVIARETLQAKRDGSYTIALAQDLGVNEAELTKLGKGTLLKVELEVRRTGSRLNPNPLKLTKSSKLKLK